MIVSGTPGGVGIFRKPPMFLKGGDEVVVHIDGLGSLTNRVALVTRAKL
jgi:2-keto-4-pentenoate hydratase/2-oxohepta-3-ene-1,7-dioic acid hydratase in catechol pathway